MPLYKLTLIIHARTKYSAASYIKYQNEYQFNNLHIISSICPNYQYTKIGALVWALGHGCKKPAAEVAVLPETYF